MIIKDVELADSSRYACQALNGINPSLSEVIDIQVLSKYQTFDFPSSCKKTDVEKHSLLLIC